MPTVTKRHLSNIESLLSWIMKLEIFLVKAEGADVRRRYFFFPMDRVKAA